MKTWKLLKNNPHLFERYFIKEYIIKACRKFFEARKYHELESPILVSALPQERFLDVLDLDIELKGNKKLKAYLTPTTETFNKKILAAGLGEHFVITKVIRGLEEIGVNHSPEFTMLEWYHLNATYFDLMDDTEELLKFVKKEIYNALLQEKELKKFQVSSEMLERFNPETDYITYGEYRIDFSKPWDRVDVSKALEECGVILSEIQEEAAFKEKMKSKGYTIAENDSWQTIFELLFASEIEPKMSKEVPTFFYNYPKQVCVLTKPNAKNPLVCEKVELYVAGKEVANGYTELLDWNLQESRFKEEQHARQQMGMKDVKFDHDLIEALKSGLPDVAGIGMGLDRIAMIYSNAKNIKEINYFPAAEMFENEE